MVAKLKNGVPPNKRRVGRGGGAGQWVLALSILVSACIFSFGFRPGQNADANSLSPIVNDFDSIQVEVPAAVIPSGTRLKDAKFKLLSYPKHQLTGDHIKNVSSFKDYVALTDIPANLPLYRQNLASSSSLSNPVQERIPPGMRAMTIRVDATSSVEGWAGSGSIVDILLIEKNRTSVVAERVKILSAERSVNPVEGRNSPTVPSTVTLLVTQDQCLAINTAIPLGKIAFALRSSHDEESWSDTDFKAAELSAIAETTSVSSKVIQGVVSLKDGQYALVDGKWVKMDSMPEGFFVGKKPQEEPAQVLAAAPAKIEVNPEQARASLKLPTAEDFSNLQRGAFASEIPR